MDTFLYQNNLLSLTTKQAASAKDEMVWNEAIKKIEQQAIKTFALKRLHHL